MHTFILKAWSADEEDATRVVSAHCEGSDRENVEFYCHFLPFANPPS